MLIDWFTVLAQIVNFLLLVWLLKRFLYKPVLAAIDAREKRIRDQLAAAKAKELEAGRQLEEFRQKSTALESQRDTFLSQAAAEAAAERRKLLDEVRKEADLLRSSRQEALKSEELDFHRELVRKTQHEVFAVAQKTLADLAGARLEEEISEVFIRRLRDLNSEARKLMSGDLKSRAPAIVRSTFELPQPQRAAIRSAVQEVFASDIPIQFETSPELVSGIELSANGYKLAWNIADYLGSLEKSIAGDSAARPRPDSASDQHGE